MSEKDFDLTREERQTQYDLLPITSDVASGIREEFLPSVQIMDWSELNQYLETLSGGPIKSGELDFGEILADAIQDVSHEEKRALQAASHQVALVRKITDNAERYYFTNPENGGSEARFYRQGAITMIEALKREADKKGGVLPILDEDTVKKAGDRYLQPERYTGLVEERDNLKADILNPDSKKLKAYTEGDEAIEDTLTRLLAVSTISLNEMIKHFPKQEPHLYKAVSQSGLLRQTGMIESKPTKKYKKALLKGAIDVRLCFLEAKKGNESN